MYSTICLPDDLGNDIDIGPYWSSKTFYQETTLDVTQMEQRGVRGKGWQTNEELPEHPGTLRKMIHSHCKKGQLTICEVGGVVR